VRRAVSPFFVFRLRLLYQAGLSFEKGVDCPDQLDRDDPLPTNYNPMNMSKLMVAKAAFSFLLREVSLFLPSHTTNMQQDVALSKDKKTHL
jgi:hypothetical protein